MAAAATNPKYIQCLKARFNIENFTDLQLDVISWILERGGDICLFAPAAIGKSLCYQFPAVFKDSISLIVSPSIPLMQDQVRILTNLGISACLLGIAEEYLQTWIEVAEGRYNIVYIAPEYISNEFGLSLLMTVVHKLALIAIDEAYLVAEHIGGQNSYLTMLKCVTEDIPFLVINSAHTDHVKTQIMNTFQLKNPTVFSENLDRPNLKFIVKPLTNPWSDISPYLQEPNIDSAVIYCKSIDEANSVADELIKHGVSCAAYHSAVPLETRKTINQNFIENQLRVIVAAGWYGTGINKSNIRCVFHYGVPDNWISYYRKACIAGRDGLRAKCVMFVQNKNEENFQQFINQTACRRRYILSILGQEYDQLQSPLDCCDNCELSEIGILSELNLNDS